MLFIPGYSGTTKKTKQKSRNDIYAFKHDNAPPLRSWLYLENDRISFHITRHCRSGVSLPPLVARTGLCWSFRALPLRTDLRLPILPFSFSLSLSFALDGVSSLAE